MGGFCRYFKGVAGVAEWIYSRTRLPILAVRWLSFKHGLQKADRRKVGTTLRQGMLDNARMWAQSPAAHKIAHLESIMHILNSPRLAMFSLCGLLSLGSASPSAAQPPFQVMPVTAEQAAEYKLDTTFYKKSTLVQNILIATSEKVPDLVHQEAAYLFDKIMSDVKPAIAQRIRDHKVLCVLVGHSELVSELPQYRSDKTGKDLDFYNWRNRGSLSSPNDRLTVLFSEEDVMEYEGGMQLESILVHEFGHVIDGAGFDDGLQQRLAAAFKHAKEIGIYNDGYAAQKFRRVTGKTPVSLLDALVKSFPAQSPGFLRQCLDGGDILVNGKPCQADVKVCGDDKVLIVFGGPKQCYAGTNAAEYWAEGVQDWYDTNRTMDHDHNHIHTRAAFKTYDPQLATLIADVLGDGSWRFVSPRERAGSGHLAGYDPASAPTVVKLEHIDTAAQDYYDGYWKDYWQRLHDKYPSPPAIKAQTPASP